MELDKQLKPELFVTKDLTRAWCTECHLDVQAKRIYATDGHRLIAVPASCENDDTSGWVSAEALAAARKLAKHQPCLTITANGSLHTGAGRSGPNFPRRSQHDATFPRVAQLLSPPPTAKALTFGVNANYIADCAKAMGTVNVQITVYYERGESHTSHPLFIGCSSQPEVQCLVMPVRL